MMQHDNMEEEDEDYSDEEDDNEMDEHDVFAIKLLKFLKEYEE